MPASARSPLTGRSCAVGPVANWGANRVSVAEAMNATALNAPITNPSNDSRVAGPQQPHHHCGENHEDRATRWNDQPLE